MSSGSDDKTGLMGIVLRWLTSQQFPNVMQVVNFAALMSVLWYGAQMARQTAIEIEQRHDARVKLIVEKHSEDMQRFIELCCGRRVEFKPNGGAVLGSALP